MVRSQKGPSSISAPDQRRSAPLGPKPRRGYSNKSAPEPAPILNGVLLAGHDLQGDFTIPRLGERGDALLQLPLSRGKGCPADQLGGYERALLGLHEHQMP